MKQRLGHGTFRDNQRRRALNNAVEEQRKKWKDKPYIEVRKVKWDGLWHAIKEKRDNGNDLYDRVEEAEAIRISRSLNDDKKFVPSAEDAGITQAAIPLTPLEKKLIRLLIRHHVARKNTDHLVMDWDEETKKVLEPWRKK